MQYIDLVHWGIFSHVEVTGFLLDIVRDSSKTCFCSWDCRILHHFGYSFDSRFRVSSLRHRLILHSDFFADYCWVGDSWLMMLDSSFWLCIKYPHWGIFPLFSEVPSCCWMVWLSLFMVIEMFGRFWQILYYASDIHTGAYSPLIYKIFLGSGMRMDD